MKENGKKESYTGMLLNIKEFYIHAILENITNHLKENLKKESEMALALPGSKKTNLLILDILKTASTTALELLFILMEKIIIKPMQENGKTVLNMGAVLNIEKTARKNTKESTKTARGLERVFFIDPMAQRNMKGTGKTASQTDRGPRTEQTARKNTKGRSKTTITTDRAFIITQMEATTKASSKTTSATDRAFFIEKRV